METHTNSKTTNTKTTKTTKPDATKADNTVRADYLHKMEAQGMEWDAQMALWNAKADKATAEVKAEFHKWQRDFHDQRGEAQRKVEALRAASLEAWEDVKTGAEAAWADVKSAYESAKSKYN